MLHQKSPRILVVDDDIIVLDALKTILELENFEVVGCCKNAQDALFLCKRYAVDVVLMDIRMPVMDGVLGTKNIKELNPKIKVIILTTFKDTQYIRQAIAFGADGYILKSSPAEHLIDSIKAVLQDKFVLDNEIAKILPQFMQSERENKGLMQNLSEKEIELITLIAEGLSNKEISEKLFLSEGTVRNYISNLLQKLCLENRTQLAIFYYKYIA